MGRDGMEKKGLHVHIQEFIKDITYLDIYANLNFDGLKNIKHQKGHGRFIGGILII